MDYSIARITPELWRSRGARAFDEGRGFDDHDLNHDANAMKDWQAGYLQRERESRYRTAAARTALVRQVARQQLGKVSPP